MTSLVRVAVIAALAAGFLHPAYASPVTVDFSGTVSQSQGWYAVGTAYSGEFSYDTTAEVLANGGNFRDFALADGAFTINIGGDILTDSGGNNDIEVDKLGNFEIIGDQMTGTGPLDGDAVVVEFGSSANSAIKSLNLPTTFPTDFSSTDLAYFAGFSGVGPFGSLGAYAEVAVPEPMTLSLLCTGLVGLIAARRRADAARPRQA